jgi:tetratricopeptide (TPR) repeat protein
LVASRLATMQLKQGEEKAAEESLLSAHEAYVGTLGEAHPATGSTLAAIAHLMRKQGRWQEALPLYERLASVTEDALGPSHPQVGIALRTLAQVRSALGRHAQAVADAEKAAAIMRKMHGGLRSPHLRFGAPALSRQLVRSAWALTTHSHTWWASADV